METQIQNRETEELYHERFKIATKNISKLENCLEREVTRFSCLLTENVKLRSEIQHLMRERFVLSKREEDGLLINYI